MFVPGKVDWTGIGFEINRFRDILYLPVRVPCPAGVGSFGASDPFAIHSGEIMAHACFPSYEACSRV
jgi:hypothetical protein